MESSQDQQQQPPHAFVAGLTPRAARQGRAHQEVSTAPRREEPGTVAAGSTPTLLQRLAARARALRLSENLSQQQQQQPCMTRRRATLSPVHHPMQLAAHHTSPAVKQQCGSGGHVRTSSSSSCRRLAVAPSSSPQHAHTAPAKPTRQQADTQPGSCRTPRLLAAAVRRSRHMQTGRHSGVHEPPAAGAECAGAGAPGLRVVLSLPWQPAGSQPVPRTSSHSASSSDSSTSSSSAESNSSADSKFAPLSRQQRLTGVSLASAGDLHAHAFRAGSRQQALPGELRAAAGTATPAAVSRGTVPSSCPQQGRDVHTPQHTTPGTQQGLEPWRLSAWLLKTDARTRPQTLVRRARDVDLSSDSGDEEEASTDTLSSSGSTSLNNSCAAGAGSMSKVCAAAFEAGQTTACALPNTEQTISARHSYAANRKLWCSAGLFCWLCFCT
jgi:hypothetical protein